MLIELHDALFHLSVIFSNEGISKNEATILNQHTVLAQRFFQNLRLVLLEKLFISESRSGRWSWRGGGTHVEIDLTTNKFESHGREVPSRKVKLTRKLYSQTGGRFRGLEPVQIAVTLRLGEPAIWVC